MNKYSLTHISEPFLRSYKLCSYSRNSQHFMEPEGSLSCSQKPSTGPYPDAEQFNPYRSFIQKISHGPRLLVVFRNKIIFYGELLAPRQNPKLEDHSLVGCPLLLIQYIRRYPPYQEVVSSIHNLRTRHAVMTRDPPDML
jgi:hypothetical protein